MERTNLAASGDADKWRPYELADEVEGEALAWALRDCTPAQASRELFQRAIRSNGGQLDAAGAWALYLIGERRGVAQ